MICDMGALSGPIVLGAVSDVSSLGAAAVSNSALGFFGFYWFAFRVAETLKEERASGGFPFAVPNLDDPGGPNTKAQRGGEARRGRTNTRTMEVVVHQVRLVPQKSKEIN